MPSLISEHQQWFDSATGELLVNGNVYIGVAGLDPEVLANQLTIYSDRALTTAIANPQTTDANGQTSNKIWIAGNYSLAVTNSALVVKYSELDNGDVGLLVQSEEQTATEGQTLITLANITYATSAGNVLAYINGVKQAPSSFTETSSSSITFTEGLNAGDLVEIITGSSITSATVIGSDLITYLPAGTGAVQTNVQAKLRESISVTDFGAVGDGVTDDTAAIQGAIDYAETIFLVANYGEGAEVELPPGVYKVSSTLTISKSGVSLRGAGRSATVITTALNITCIYFGRANPEDNQTMPGVGVSHMTVRNSFVDPTASIGIHFDRARESWIDNCQIRDYWEGIRLAGTGESVRITDTDISAGQPNTALQTDSSGINITRREVNASDPNGIQDAADSLYYTEPNSVFLTNLNIRSFSGYGMVHGVKVDAIDGLYVNNGHWGFSVTSQFFIKASQANLPISNVFVNNLFIDPAPGTSAYGIFYQSNGALASNTVANHLYTGVVVAGATTAGINIKGDGTSPKRVIFTGSMVRDSAANHVLLQNGENISFTGCTFQNSGTSVADINVTAVDGLLITGSTFSVGLYRAVQTALNANTKSLIFANNKLDSPTNRGLYLQHTSQGDKISNNITSVASTVASASNLQPELLHDTLHVTGTSTISTIDSVAASGKHSFDGREIKLIFDGILTFTHGNAGAGGIITKTGASYTTAANDIITLVYDETLDKWLEI